MPSERVTAICEFTPVRETRVGEDDDRSPSEAVAEVVASAEESTPTQLPPLYESIDPDALDQLVSGDSPPDSSPLVVQFSHAGWNVFVRGDGTIRLCDPTCPSERAPAFEKPLHPR